MTTRTVQFWGQGYSLPPAAGLSLTPCTITATVDGNVAFSGTIPTLESSDVARLPGEQTILFTVEIPLVTGTAEMSSYTIPVSLAITGDDVFLEQVMANYSHDDTGASTGPTGFSSITSGDPKSNVVITNATFYNPPPDPRTPGTDGTWGWEIETAPGQTSTFSFDLVVDCGVE